jgi:hypothetical protein
MNTPFGPLYAFLQQDHAELDQLLRRAQAAPKLDLEAYDAFRRGLLRHIAMEEKILLPEARRLRAGEPLPIAKQLRADHAALAALLVPTPTHEIVATIRDILNEHNPLEEDPGGLYQQCEELAGADIDALVERVKASPEVPVAKHYDGPRAHEGIERLLRARRAVHEP